MCLCICVLIRPLSGMKSSLKNGRGWGGCHGHAATGAPVVSLSPPARLTAVKTPQHPFTLVQMPPTDVNLTFVREGGKEEGVEVWGRQERKVISGAKQGGQVSPTQQRREESRVENASVSVITGASEEKSLSQAQTSAHRGGNLSG